MKCLLNNTEVSYPCSPKCALFGDCVTAFQKPSTTSNADRIRAMVATDAGIAKILLALDISFAEDGREFTHLYCDGKNNCITEDDEIICTDEMRTACIMRWLQRPAEEVKRET